MIAIIFQKGKNGPLFYLDSVCYNKVKYISEMGEIWWIDMVTELQHQN